ncbi:MAG: GAF domain-containing protein [Acidobacteriota bacterium]
MFNYLAFIHHGITLAGQDAYADGRELASECLAQLRALDNPEQFPPRLFILLASPAYLEAVRAQALLDGVHETCGEFGHQEIALIGSTVSAVFFNQDVHPRGALLVCLASHRLEAEVGAGEDARRHPESAVRKMLRELNLDFPEEGRDLNPLNNRLLFTFFPGFDRPDGRGCYTGPELHATLRKQMRARVPLVGGGSATSDRARAGLQFAGRRVHVDAIVAAKLTTGFPFTSSIGHGLTPSGSIYHVGELGSDNRTILKFVEGVPAELLGLNSPDDFRLFGELSLDDDPLITVARTAADSNGHSGAVRMLRELQPGASLELLHPDRDRMRREAADLMDWSLRRLRVEHPVGIIGLHCSSWLQFGPPTGDLIDDVRRVAGIDAQDYVGGFFEGEIGQGQTGRTLFGNWCASQICFGDELRERTPFYSGFEAMTRLSQALATVNTLEEAIEQSLELIYQTGYPGAMLSSLFINEGEMWLVPTQAKGSRYKQILARVDQAKREVSDDDLFTQIWKGDASPLILDTHGYAGKEFTAYHDLSIVSQYIKPIRNYAGKSLAFLQIDLGDLRYKKRLQEEELRVIDSLSIVVEATLTRLFNRIEAHIARALDAALLECLALPGMNQALQRYIEKAVKIFSADMGHIRLARYEDNTLMLVAGTGDFYQAQRQLREKLPLDGDSPTSSSFRNKRPLVINDARHNPFFRRLAEAFSDQPPMARAINEIGSYANVIFNNERGEPMGAINLLSKRPWFFTRPLVRSLKAMGQRIGILIEHHKRQNQHRFLSEIGKVYEDTEGFKEPLATLRDATKRCSEAAHADIACLYLWDDEVKKYILYSQSGWTEDWVKAARFGENDPWIGHLVIQSGRPLYIPDVHHFKVEHGTENLLRYSKSMFGAYFSDSLMVEALALPLKLKGKGGKNRGVFILYREVKPDRAGHGEGFTVTDLAVLEEAAKSLAVMVSGQLRREAVLWERDENKRRERVRKEMFNINKRWTLDETLCREMLNYFNASWAGFYHAGRAREGLSLQWAVGFEDQAPGQRPPARLTQAEEPDALLLHAAREGRVEFERFVISEAGYMQPEIAKQEGLIKRLCLPMISERRVIGMLDIRWDADRLPQRPVLPQRPAANEQFRQYIGEIYRQQEKSVARREIEREKKRNRLAAQTMGVMLFQSTHRVMNLVQELRAMPRLIAAAGDDATREHRLRQLTELINSATDRIQQPMEAAKRTRVIEPSRCNLRNLIARVLDQVPHLSQVEIKANVHEKIIVWADAQLIEEAFVNIVQNAFKAMPNGGLFSVRAVPVEPRKIVQIIFTDTGPGMSQEEIKTALMGFKSKRESTGMGVLTSLLMVTANNGKLGIKSKPGHGTKVIVSLPTEPEEL